MTENVEDQVNLSQTSRSEPQTPHFLRDVIFHGKFKRLKALTPEENTRSQHGLFFQDGQRRVDYVLTYSVKKSSGGHSSRQPAHLLAENAVTRSLRHGPQSCGEQPQQAQRTKGSSSLHSSAVIDMELSSPGEIFNGQEDQKSFRREEFEGKLRDMGLELETDEDEPTIIASSPKRRLNFKMTTSFSLS